MGVNPEDSHGVVNDGVSGTTSVGSRRAVDSFHGLPMARAALRFASARHANHRREVDHAPFIAHPIEVGSLLCADGQPDEVIAAGLLHDVLEKTGTSRAELKSRFGARVAGLVESVSDDPSIDDYSARKRELRDRVAHAGSDTVAIFAADKISKVRELTQLPTSCLGETTTRAKLAHYRASLKMLRRVAGNSILVDLLDAELNRLSHKPVTGTHGGGLSQTSPAQSGPSRELAQPEPVRRHRS